MNIRTRKLVAALACRRVVRGDGTDHRRSFKADDPHTLGNYDDPANDGPDRKLCAVCSRR